MQLQKVKPVCADEIEAAAARLGGEHENEVGAGGIVELVHHLGPLLDGHGAVKADVPVVAQPAQLLEHVQGLRVVRHQNHLCNVSVYCIAVK
jgi:hypothetical protein